MRPRTLLNPATTQGRRRLVTADRLNPFGDRNSLVVRALLDRPQHVWRVTEMADTTGVVLPTVSVILHQLAARGVVRAERIGRERHVTVADPTRLVAAWNTAYDWQRNPRLAVHAPIGDPGQFLKRLPRLMVAAGGPRWALTLQAGAWLVAPHARWQRVYLYVDVEDERSLFPLARDLGWPLGPDGNLVLMRPWYRRTTWHNAQMIRGIPVVSDAQLVADLWSYPERGREQTEYLLTHRLGWEL